MSARLSGCRDPASQRLTVRVADADVGKADDLLGSAMRGLQVGGRLRVRLPACLAMLVSFLSVAPPPNSSPHGMMHPMHAAGRGRWGGARRCAAAQVGGGGTVCCCAAVLPLLVRTCLRNQTC